MSAPAPYVLVLNAGSSSLKFALFTGLARRHQGQVEGIGTQPRLLLDAGAPAALPPDTRHDGALTRILQALGERGIQTAALSACGHRVVHGGARFMAPLLLDAGRLAALGTLRELAPLHNAPGLAVIAAMRRAAPALAQIACFDTAFHASVPELAARYALPAPLHEAGYRRFGFHGLNFEHVTTTLEQQFGPAATARLLIFHLGNGCSLCAVRDGRSVATTMGYSTLDGLVMGTRCGALDPGVLLALQRQERLSVEALEQLLYRGSGLLGVSGVSSDMRELERRDDAACRFAIEHFCYWAARHAGSLVAALEGLDGVAFTGGIGAHSARVRAGIAQRLGWLGLELDTDRNARHEAQISTPRSRCRAWVIAADEERAILRHVHALLDARE
ncbi:MAG: acetate/propionate family kinase [Gammaproteobacteria bacterium]|nr:acetate/propionate family kinase [Gammaproteobacteria bacterium]MBV9621768.1 acetate/propionate family kinase [Gammaproteobacteria bacterium]